MIDKNYLKELTKSLRFNLDDEQVDKLVMELSEIDGMIQHAKKTVDPSITPVNYPRVKNCGKLRKDTPVDNKDKKEYLSNAKVADKYVVGK